MKKALTLAICAGVLLALAAPAFAQPYPPPRPATCRAQDKTVEPGQTVLFGGKRWQKNSPITAGFNQKLPGPNATVITGTTTDSTGRWSVSITIPSDVRNGPAVFGAKGLDKGQNKIICIYPVTVVGAPSAVNASATDEPAGVTTGMATALVVALLGTHLVIRHRRMKSLTA